jgi:hypothetical protein
VIQGQKVSARIWLIAEFKSSGRRQCAYCSPIGWELIATATVQLFSNLAFNRCCVNAAFYGKVCSAGPKLLGNSLTIAAYGNRKIEIENN